MKNKILAVLTTAIVGVASFMPGMTAKAYEMQCYRCGEWSIIDEVMEYKYETLDDFRSCSHGHKGYADNLTQQYALVRYYCSDCDIHWENWEKSGAYVFCTFDGKYYVY